MEVTYITEFITNKLHSSIHKASYTFPLLRIAILRERHHILEDIYSISNGTLVLCILPFTAEQTLANAVYVFWSIALLPEDG
jgi:hypothetical protein